MRPLKQKDFFKSLTSLATSYRAAIESAYHGFDDSAQAIAKRQALARDEQTGFAYFVQTYFPHYVRTPELSKLHEYLFEHLPKLLDSPKSARLAIAAPRGEAKSTLVSQLYTLYRICLEKTHYALIVMDSIDQAYPMLEAIKAELAFNLRLKLDFAHAFGIGRVWQSGSIVTANGIKVQVAGAGKKLRGLRHGAYRPDYVVLDDIENDDNVRQASQRDKLHSWLNKTILPLGAAGEKLDIIYIGTVLHYDSVLNRTLNHAAWTSARFRALIAYPHNMSLWDTWEALYLAKDLPAAARFYHQHKQAMEAGAVVSWAARPLLELMTIRASVGHGAFDSEYQNDPTAGDSAPFNHAIHYWGDIAHPLPPALVYFGAVDPSLGKAGLSRDPSAIVIAGLDRNTGKVYIIRAEIKKRLPDRIISDIIALQKEFSCRKWAVEAVQFQEFLRTELIKRGQAQGVPIPAVAVKPTSDKLLRIESLQPHMANGQLLLHASQSTLIDQFRHFPKADHDDGCDAVEMVYKLAIQDNRQSTMQPMFIPEPSLYS